MPNCPFCEKTGLPILPVRYAVARTEGAGQAPAISRPFAQAIDLPETSAQYTLRLLRSGYLYVYDEGIDWWSAYVVSKQGNLFEFDVEAVQPPSVGDRHPCSRGTDPYKARCITIPDVQSATRVWLGFSDTAWTKDVLDKHSDADYRNAHMTRINVAEWLSNGANQTHMASMTELAQRVAEFAPGCQGGDTARASLGKLEADDNPLPAAVKRKQIARNKAHIPFSFADNALQQLGRHTQALVDWARQQGQETVEIAQLAGMAQITHGAPAIVGLQDPVGIGVDLNALIVQLLEEWQELADPERLWKKVSSDSILALEQAVKSQAVIHEQQHRDTMARQRYQQDTAGQRWAWAHQQRHSDASWPCVAAPPDYPQWLAARSKKYPDTARVIPTKEAAQAIGDRAWKKFTRQNGLYNESQRQADDNAFQEQLTSYDESHITPISQAWLAWAKSDVFKAQFTHNHDPNHIDSGMSFVTLMTHAVRHAAGRADVKTFLAKQLAKDPADRNNIWIRALALDQDTLVEQLSAGLVDLTQPGSFAAQGALFLTGVAKLGEPEHQVKAQEQTENTRQWLAARQTQLIPIQNRMAAFMRTTAGALLEALGDLPQDLVLGGVQNRLLTAMAAAGYDASARHYVFAQQAMLTEQQKLDFVTRVLQRMSAAPNSPAPMPIKHIVRNAHSAVAGEDAPPQVVHSLAWLTQDSAEQLGLATPAEQGQGKAGQWHVSSEATGSVDAATLTKTQAASTRLVTLDSTAFHVGVVGMLLSTWSFAGMAKQEYAASAGKTTHLAVTAVALAGQYMEVTGSVLQDTKWGATKLSKPIDNMLMQATTNAQKLAGMGRIVGALGGLVLGVWQGIKGLQELDKNWSLALFNMGMGFGMAVLFTFMLLGIMSGFGSVLLIALAMVAFIWHFFVNDKYQNWLTRCYYGAGPNKFGNMAEQQTAFHRIRALERTPEEPEEDPVRKHLYYGYRQIPGVS